jgi:1-aminocyclopropane-1-carboxylate deaminase
MQVSTSMTKIEDLIKLPTPLQKWDDPLFKEKGVEVYVKRDDLSHQVLAGNKFRKLKYSLLAAERGGFDSLLSFGGAFSNHLYAMAGVCKYTAFKVRMIVRGEELHENSSPTLAFAHQCGAELIFVSRTAYRDKKSLAHKFGQNSFIIPEGGSNEYCLQGVSEMVDEITNVITPSHIAAAMGTGGTVAGLLSSSFNGTIIGVSALKGGGFLRNDVFELLKKQKDFMLFEDYHFGGYARHTPELLDFIKQLDADAQIPLEHVYTGKLFYAIKDQIKEGEILAGSCVVIYHSGGLQGKMKA